MSEYIAYYLPGVVAVSPFLASAIFAAIHIHSVWEKRTRFHIEVLVGANLQGARGYPEDRDKVRVSIINLSPNPVTLSLIGFTGKSKNEISPIYPKGLIVDTWVNGNKLESESPIILEHGAEAILVARVTLIPSILECNAIEVVTNTKYRKELKLPAETLSSIRSARENLAEEHHNYLGKGNPNYSEDCLKGAELLLPQIDVPLNLDDDPNLIAKWLFGKERECFVRQASMRRFANIDDVPHLMNDYLGRGEKYSIYDNTIESVVMDTYMIEQGRREELGQEWSIQNNGSIHSLGSQYRHHLEASSRYEEWCEIAESRRLSIYNMLTHQEDTTSETRSLILKHQKACVTCMTISNTRA